MPDGNHEIFLVAVHQLWDRGWRWMVGVIVLWIVLSQIPAASYAVGLRLLPLEWVGCVLVLSIQLMFRGRFLSPGGLVLWSLWLVTAVVDPQGLTLRAWQQGLHDNLIQWVLVSSSFAWLLMGGLIGWGLVRVFLALTPFIADEIIRIGRFVGTLSHNAHEWFAS